MEGRGGVRGGGRGMTDQGGDGETRRPADLVDWWALVEMRELEATVEPLGRRTEVESGPQRLIAELWDPPDLSPMELELGRPAAIPCHRWWAERLTGSNGEGIEEGNRSMRGGGRGRVGWIFDQVNRSGEDWRTGISEWKSIKSPRSSLCSPPFPLPPRSLNPYPPSLVFSALTPGQTLWAHRLSALSLLMAMAQRPRQLWLSVCGGLGQLRATGVVIDWALGPKWGWCDLQDISTHSKKAAMLSWGPSPDKLCYWGGVSSIIERTVAVCPGVVCEVAQEHKVIGVVLNESGPSVPVGERGRQGCS